MQLVSYKYLLHLIQIETCIVCILVLMYMFLGSKVMQTWMVLLNLLLSCRSIIGQDFAGFKDNLLALVYAMPFVS